MAAWDISRADLHRLVWSEPIRDAAKRFGVSDVAVGKVCRKFGVPLPGRGYWMRAPARRRVVALPPPPFGMPDRIYLATDGWSSVDEVRIWEPAEPTPDEALLPLKAQRERARLLVGNVPIPYRLKPMHQLTQRMIDGTFGDPKQPSETAVDRRRIRLINAIFLAAEKAGGRPQLPHDVEWFGIAIGRQLVRFKIERVPSYPPRETAPPPPSELDPLRLEIRPFGEAWRDRGDNLLDYHLQEIVAELFVTADRAGRG